MYKSRVDSWLKMFIFIIGFSCSTALFAKVSPTFQIVESVPEASIYGTKGIPHPKEVWLDMINDAKKKIDITAFYISNKKGKALEPVIDALEKRAQQGIKVRILVGKAFLKYTQPTIDRLSKVNNIEIRVIPVGKLTGGVLHEKSMVVDDNTVFIGSQNWDWRAMTEIHEIGVRIHNERFAKTVDATFEFNWKLANDPNMPIAKKKALEPLDFSPVTMQKPVVLKDHNGHSLTAFAAFSPPAILPHGFTAEQPALVQMIRASQHIVRVQVMTLSAIKHYGPKGWWPQIDSALRDAAARGVKVHIIVADWALHEPMQSYLKSLAILPNITVKYSTVPAAPGGFIAYARVEHAKYAVVDDSNLYIGTGNWQWSYFNTTVDASVFAHGKAAETLIDIFDRDWNGPYVTTIDPAKTYKPARNH